MELFATYAGDILTIRKAGAGNSNKPDERLRGDGSGSGQLPGTGYGLSRVRSFGVGSPGDGSGRGFHNFLNGGGRGKTYTSSTHFLAVPADLRSLVLAHKLGAL